MKWFRWMAAGLLVTGLGVLSACFNTTEVKIGVIIPQKGSSLEDYGFQISSGIEMALDDARAKGELNKTYSLVRENEDLNDIESVKAAFTRLVEKEGVSAVIGPASSAAMKALVPMANEAKVTLLSPAASSPEINSGDVNSNDFIFRNQPSDTLEAQALSDVIFNKCRIQKLLMVRSRNTYAAGITYEMLRFARQNSDRIPGEVVKFSSNVDEADFVSVVDRIVELAPEGVFMGGYTDDIVPLIIEIRNRPELANTYLFTSSSFLPEKVVTLVGQDAAEGIMFTTYPWAPSTMAPHIQDFAQRFKERFFVDPDNYAANGYDAGIILVHAIEKARHWMVDAVRDEMNGNNFDMTTTHNLILRETDFNKRGDVTRIPSVYKVQAGKVVKLTPEDMETIKTDILTRI